MRLIKLLCLMLSISILCTGCKPKSDFNAYRHMSRIMTITTQEQYNHDKELILSHVSEELKPQIDKALTGTVYDDDYSIIERNMVYEQLKDQLNILIEYDCMSSGGDYLLVAYFEYVDDILTSYTIHKINKMQLL